MKQKQKRLMIAFISSLIVTTFLTGLIWLYTAQQKIEPQSYLMSDLITQQTYVSYWLLGIISITIFLILALLFYFFLQYFEKRKLI